MKNIFFLLLITPFFSFAQRYQEGEVLDFFVNNNKNLDSLRIDTISLYKRRVIYGYGSDKITYNLLNLNGKWVKDSIISSAYKQFPSYKRGHLKKLRLCYSYFSFEYEELYDIKNQKADGTFFCYENNRLIQKGGYKTGFKNGHWTTFYPNGGIKEVMHYTLGVKDGTWQTYYADGKVASKGKYLKKTIMVHLDTQTGRLFRVCDKDTLRDYSDTQYKQDLVLYNCSNSLANRFPFRIDLKNGIWFYFDENGWLVKKEFFENGIFEKEEQY
jgi:antitoxin component YwqK of YwqJK toxin-antitoxin module